MKNPILLHAVWPVLLLAAAGALFAWFAWSGTRAYPPLADMSRIGIAVLQAAVPDPQLDSAAPQTGGISAAVAAPNLEPFVPLPVRPAYRFLPQAEGSEPEFRKFVRQVSSIGASQGQSLVRGVWVADTLALPVVQQPVNDPAFVSEQAGEVTQFGRAADNGVTGLLAHNYLAGKLFYSLEVGQEVRVVYGNGRFRRYSITAIQQYRKLTPDSLTSDYIDLDDGARLTTEALFGRVYRDGPRLTFQTCLERNGDASWGLIFFIAEPLEN